MEFNTAYYRQPGAEGVSLLVQQAVVGKKKHNVLFACIFEMALRQNGVEISGWFWEKALLAIETKGRKRLEDHQLLENLKEDFMQLVENLNWNSNKLDSNKKIGNESSCVSVAGILCMDTKAVLFQRGRVGIYLLGKRFLKSYIRKVELPDEEVWMLEPGSRILLATEGFFDSIDGALVSECLGKEHINGEKQLMRRMQDLGEVGEEAGGQEMAAVCICCEEH